MTHLTRWQLADPVRKMLDGSFLARSKRMRTPTRRWLLMSVGAVAVLATAGCSTSSADLEPVDPPPSESDDAATSTSAPKVSALDIALVVPEGTVVGDALSRVEQIGTVPVAIAIVSRSGGDIAVSEGRVGEPVLRMPLLLEGKDPPRAVVRVTARSSSTDPLAPGEANFSFGADFLKDRKSSGTKVDNGDNLIQRGLASDPSQYKIEVDRGRPACRIAGSEGAVEVKADKKVSSGRWYRVRCTREGDTVTLDLTEYAPYERVVEASSQAEGRIGSVAWPQSETPLSIGGKLAANGDIIKSATDEFNGLIGNPVLTIGG